MSTSRDLKQIARPGPWLPDTPRTRSSLPRDAETPRGQAAIERFWHGGIPDLATHVVVQCALTAAAERGHEEVEARLLGRWPLGDEAFHDQDPCVVAACLDAAAEDLRGARVDPAVQHLGEDVRVARREWVVEDVSRDDGQALRRFHAPDDLRQVEQRAADARMCGEERCQHDAGAAPDVDHVGDGAPVVLDRDLIGVGLHLRRHERVKRGGAPRARQFP